MTGRRFAADTETNGLLDTVSRMHSLVLIDLDTGEVISCADQPGFRPLSEGLQLLAEAALIVGQNWIRYDDPAIRKLYPWWDTKAAVRDTLVLSRLIWGDLKVIDAQKRKKGLAKGQPYALPPALTGQHGLEAWGYRLGLLKGDYGKQDDAWERWTPEMQEYCVRDVQVTVKFWELIHTKRWTEASVEMEHAFAWILATQERRGFEFDERAAQALLSTLVGRRLELEQSLKSQVRPWFVSNGVSTPKKDRKLKRPALGEVTTEVIVRGKRKVVTRPVLEEETAGAPFTKIKLREFNPSSRQQVGDRLIKLYGWEPDEFTPEGQPKVDETILEKLSYPITPDLAAYFLVQKRIGQLSEGDQAWLRLVRNGRIYGSVNTLGAVTGRCTHSNPNVSQVPASGSAYGHECRSLFRATTALGWVLVGCDAGGLELRCLAHFLYRYDGGAFARALLEGDIHWINVQAMGLTAEARNAENPYHAAFRDVAKTFVYGFLYGCGDVKAGKILWDLILRLRREGLEYLEHQARLFGDIQGTAPTEAELARAGKKLKTRFLKRSPALKKLREVVADKAKAQGYILGLDGRVLKIRSAHAALNTLLQSAGALVVKMATVILHRLLRERGYVLDRDFAQVAHIHDEIQLECRKEIADAVGTAAKEAMALAGQHFTFRLPIDGDFKIGLTWADTH